MQVGRIMIGVTFACIITLLAAVIETGKKVEELDDIANTLVKTIHLASELRQSSDDLTRLARTYVVTGNHTYWDYFESVIAIRDGKMPLPIDPYRIYWDLYVLNGPPRNSTAPESLESRMRTAGFTQEEFDLITLAKQLSDDLINLETRAYNSMRGIDGPINQTLAIELMHGWDYHMRKAEIMRPIDVFFVKSSERSQSLGPIKAEILVLMGLQIAVIVLLLGVTGALLYLQYLAHLERLRLKRSTEEAEIVAFAIGHFNLEAVAYLEEVENPDSLQAGFIQIMANLRLYKPYLPPHLLENDSDDEVSMGTSKRKSDARLRGASDGSSNKSSGSRTTISVSEKTKERLSLGIARRQVIAVAVCADYGTHPPEDVTAPAGWLSDLVVSAANELKGVASMTPFGQYLICFASGWCMSREMVTMSLLMKLLAARGADQVSFMNVRCGVASGTEVCGNIGGSHFRGLVFAGEAMKLAICVADVAQASGSYILADEVCVKKLHHAVAVLRTRVLTGGVVRSLYEVLGERVVENEEWLYQMQSSDESPTACLNKALRCKFLGELVPFEIPSKFERDGLRKPYSLDWAQGDLASYIQRSAVVIGDCNRPKSGMSDHMKVSGGWVDNK